MSRVNILMDMSMYDLFLLCPERFRYRYKMNKSLPKKAMPLDRGTIIHVGQEFYYEALRNGVKYQERVDLALMKIKEAGVIQSDLEPEYISHIVEVMEQYYDFWRYQDEKMVIHDVEKSFIKVIYEDDELRIATSGKIDLMFTDDRYQEAPMDHKSYDRYYDGGRLVNQFRCYCNAVERNVLIVNKIGMHKLDGKKPLKPEEKFLRIPMSYDPLMLGEWRDNVVLNMMYYLQCEATGKWPMNETSCDKYNRKCEYYDICDSSGMPAKLFKIANNYINIEPWDVTKILKKSSTILEKSE